MARSNDNLIDQLLLEAETQSICLIPPSPAVSRALRRRLGTTVASPLPGMFVRKSTWGTLDQAQRHRMIVKALARLHPDWVFCSFSAASIWGLEVSWKFLGVAHICSSTKPTTRKPKHIRRHRIEPRETTVVDGVNVTPLIQTVADCLLETGFVDGMPIADSTLGSLEVERDAVREEIESRPRARQALKMATALKTLERADARAESGGESVARAVMIEKGFAPDHLQYELSDPFNPQSILRNDFAWERMAPRLTLGELDGFAKYTDEKMLAGKTTAEALVAERQREAHLSVYGHPLVRFSMRDVRTPGVLESILQTAGIRQSAPPSWLGEVNP